MGVIVPSPPGGKPINVGVVLSATLQNAATADGNGTDFDITGMATTVLLVNPTAYTGTITFYASPDGTTFDKIKGNRQDTTTIADNVANPGSTASIWTFQTAGLAKIRAVMSSSGGTSCTVTGYASPFPNSVPLGVTLSSAVLAAGSALVGGVNLVDSGGTNKAGVDALHNQYVTSGGTTAVSVASATPGAVKASAGRLCRVIITTLGTGSQVFYDNASAASGTILFATAASAPVGTIYDIQAPAANGIYAAGAASTPVCTVLYS